jgi:ribonuclease VapC
MTTVVDASVVLAWLQDEPGSDAAEPLLMEGLIGAANWSEVVQKGHQHGVNPEVAARLLNSFGLRVADVTQDDAEVAAGLWRRDSALSLGDRLCLALAQRLGLPAATADAAWRGVSDGPEIIFVR